MTRVVVLGGKSPLRAAAALGAECVFVESPHRLSAGKIALADHVIGLDFTDVGALGALLAAWHAVRPLDAIISMTEQGLLPAATVSAALGLPGPSVHTVTLLRDKAAMRARLAEAGHGVAALPGGTAADVRRFAAAHGYPCVVKPVDGAGSAGVTLVTDDAGAAAAVARAGHRFLVEEYLRGPEYSVETLSFDGEHVPVAITEKFVGAGFVEIGHLVPARVPAEVATELAAATRCLLDAVGLRDGAAHTELILTPDGARVVESHNRVGGDRINELVRQAYGVDMVHAAVDWLLNRRRAAIPAHPVAAASIRFLTPRPGLVTAVHGEAAVRADPAAVEVEITAEPGAVLAEIGSSHHRAGFVVTCADRPGEALDTAIRLAGTIRIDTARIDTARIDTARIDAAP